MAAEEVTDPWETPHEPGVPGCNFLMHCYSHGVDEPIVDEPYLTCFECKHVYQTDVELIDAYNEGARECVLSCKEMGWEWSAWGIREVVSADEVAFCPCCMHDF